MNDLPGHDVGCMMWLFISRDQVNALAVSKEIASILFAFGKYPTSVPSALDGQAASLL